ncbi:laccase domain protein [Amylibacter marinus]|uniref:Purine nucleoside phosphorylase n=1 Tax=Amylibacter marinus TaxID=1475483 RepID=A0ABQ5VQZ6_9RHOB|nr:peptidoglycan editing factor PgeF [Amylibacter marinus]GLQ33837.1 laccase domain protein [Amylibacter marinus]
MTLEIITSDPLSQFRHGFFTRRGGVSSGIFKGLNCGRGSSDQRDAVDQNRMLVATAMEVDLARLSNVYQYHSAEVVAVDGPQNGQLKADAMVSKTANLALGILTADCAPILFADAKNGVIGAAHSGWKGAMGGISENTVAAMVKLGAARGNIIATIGPCISQRNYEVGQDFYESFCDQAPSDAQFFTDGKAGKYQFDLPGFCLKSLQECDIKLATWTGHCTYAEPDRFYSYRRATHLNQPDYGRLISAISL